MIRINIDVDAAKTIKYLEGMTVRAKDFRLVFEQAKKKLELANAENFTSGGLPVGGWSPRRDPKPWPTMIKTGRLMGSLTSLDGPANVITATTAHFGTDVEYAAFHQTGTRKMAARQVVFEPFGWGAEIADDAADHVMGIGRYFAR